MVSRDDMVKQDDMELAFEAADDSAGVLAHYDSVKAAFTFSKASPFWYGVELAHADGNTGQGRRIAIIDSAFDLSRGRLREQAQGAPRMNATTDENSDHGTAVALLVSEVAPDARLDLYEIAQDGRPNRAALVRAIAMAAASDADIINLSIGHAFGGPHTVENMFKPPPPHACELSAAVDDAVKAGKVVVAAVGNREGSFLCPAQVPGIAAIGYNSEERRLLPVEGGFKEVSAWRKPSYSQSVQPAFTLIQPEGVLGSSFAAPLASGLAALAHDPAEILKIKNSARLGADGSEISVLLADMGPTQALIDMAVKSFDAAIDALPHRPNPRGDARCPACAILTHFIYVNAGELQLRLGNVARAETLLRYARWLAPWSADANATLGRLVEYKAESLLDPEIRQQTAKHFLTEAAQLYEDALRQRPGHQGYQTELEKIHSMAAKL